MTLGNGDHVPKRIVWIKNTLEQQLELAPLSDPLDDQADTEPAPPPSRPPMLTSPETPDSISPTADTVPPPSCNEPPMPPEWEVCP